MRKRSYIRAYKYLDTTVPLTIQPQSVVGWLEGLWYRDICMHVCMSVCACTVFKNIYHFHPSIYFIFILIKGHIFQTEYTIWDPFPSSYLSRQGLSNKANVD